jgi:hypothetical protein
MNKPNGHWFAIGCILGLIVGATLASVAHAADGVPCGGAGLPACRDYGAPNTAQVTGDVWAEREKLRVELAVHAPPVPEWFRPELGVRMVPCDIPGAPVKVGCLQSPTPAQQKRRMAEWPWAYADMVLKVRKP